METRLEFSDFLSQFKHKLQNSGELYPVAVNRTCKELIVVKGFNERPHWCQRHLALLSALKTALLADQCENNQRMILDKIRYLGVSEEETMLHGYGRSSISTERRKSCLINLIAKIHLRQ